MPSWLSGYVNANNIRLHYHRTGGDKPPVVLCHGLTDNGLGWTRLAQALEETYDLIMVDARGHGLSDVPESGYGLEEHAAAVAGLIQALGLSRPALIGHSMGADAVAHTAAHYPESVGCAVLEDPPWYEGMAAAELRAGRAHEWHATMLERKATPPEALPAVGRAQHPAWRESEFGPWVQAKQQVSLNVLQYLSAPRPDWRETMDRITCPTLLITADPELGARVTAEEAAGLRARNPRLEVVHIAGAGHNIRREQFEAYLSAVSAFLAEWNKPGAGGERDGRS